MKISSRPQQDDDAVSIGSGSVTLHLSDLEFELVTALVAHCRLGRPGGGASPYTMAAGSLFSMIENSHGDDFIDEACNDVDLQATIEDGYGNVIAVTNSQHTVTLEV